MPFHVSSPYLLPIGLLICSNLFMTVAWYGHLRFKEVPLLGVILASWGIALIEYCFAVPANRFGNAVYSAAQLKTMQEVITLLVFAGFSLDCLRHGRSDAGSALRHPARTRGDPQERAAETARPHLHRAGRRERREGGAGPRSAHQGHPAPLRLGLQHDPAASGRAAGRFPY